jgi:hypothetical protein
MSSKVVYEGWMVRYGRRKIGRSFIHMRYFVLESWLLAYYKRKPQDNQVPIKTLLIDGNCRVEVEKSANEPVKGKRKKIAKREEERDVASHN